ncbi:hypothetical protein IC9_01735 [Bacillus toyonensis]|uniref:hypothetical protein n=1 Tax=Bacillus toyonensis TaxID=155322 RepID=UPI00027A8101|nr:hypothetical protein [Bacillus toyonensis]EJS54402.1 hypothetical protein IC9_01735 [Bacillus toyonensis]
MDLQSRIEVVSKILEVVSKVLGIVSNIQEITSKFDVRLVVGIISLGGVIFTAFMTFWNVKKTNNLKEKLEAQTNNLKQKLADQTNEITKELGEKNLKALEQRRYIDAISIERVKWINNLRDNFSDFLKNVNLQLGDILKLISEKQKNNEDVKLESDKQKVDKDKMRERLGEIMYVGNHNFLLLNPTEPICKKIRKLQLQIFESLEKFNGSEFDNEKVRKLVDELSFCYQVVLKAEWKRVKEENKEGKEINQETLNGIYKEASKKLNDEVYDNLYNQSES